jgi:hypothetical protein
VIEVVGHSGRQAPQAMQSSVILRAMVYTPFELGGFVLKVLYPPWHVK